MSNAGESHGTPTAAFGVNGVHEGDQQRHQAPPGYHQQQQSHPQAQHSASGGLTNGSSMSLQDQQQAAHTAGSQPAPVASTSTAPPSSSKPQANKIRKRQRVEYDPVKRFYAEHPGTWDALQVEEVVSHASSKRQKRTARDLGMCDHRPA